MATAPFLKPLSMADSCLASLPALFPSPSSSKTPHRAFVSLSFKPSKPLPLSFSPAPLLLSLRRRLPLAPLVAQTSDWARQEEENNVDEEAPEWVEEGQGPPEGEGAEAGLEEWEGEDGADGGVVAEGEPEGEGGFEGQGGEEEDYPEPPEDAKLFVGNIPYDLDSEKLAQLFEKAGIVEVAEVIYNRETDQSRGFGFVTMSTVEEADKAIELFHRYDVDGRLLTVNRAAPRGARPERREFERESTFRMYVGNLPWQVDDARLEQVFSEHGKVVNARVVYDRETGRSRGFGFVTMASQTELDDAIAALDGQTLDGRAIRVNVAEERPRRM